MKLALVAVAALTGLGALSPGQSPGGRTPAPLDEGALATYVDRAHKALAPRKITWYFCEGPPGKLTWADLDCALPKECATAPAGSPEEKICGATGAIYCRRDGETESRFLTTGTVIEKSDRFYFVSTYHSVALPGVSSVPKLWEEDVTCAYYREMTFLSKDSAFDDRKIATVESLTGVPLSRENFRGFGGTYSVDGSGTPESIMHELDASLVEEAQLASQQHVSFVEQITDVSQCSSVILAGSFLGVKRYRKISKDDVDFRRLAPDMDDKPSSTYFPHWFDTTPGFSGFSISCVKVDETVVPMCVQATGSQQQVNADLQKRPPGLWKTQGPTDQNYWVGANLCTNIQRLFQRFNR